MAHNINEKSGEVGIYLKEVDGRMLACTKDGSVLSGQFSVDYRTGVDEIDRVSVSVFLCGILPND